MSFKTSPHQSTVVRESIVQMESLGKSLNDIGLWIQLFYNILDDEYLIEKLWNKIKVAMGAEGNPYEFIVSNHPERKESRVYRRRRRMEGNLG